MRLIVNNFSEMPYAAVARAAQTSLSSQTAAPRPLSVRKQAAAVKSAAPATRYRGRTELPPRAYETIRRVEIRNFKALESIDFEFPEPSAEEDRRRR